VERGELTFAVSFPGHEGLGSRLLFPVCALAVMSSDCQVVRAATVDVADVTRERLLMLRSNFLTRQWFDTACRHAHLRPNIALESAAPHALIALARVGYGVAIVPSHTPFDPRGLRTAALVQRGKALGAWAAIAWDPNRFQPPFVQRFVEELTTYSRRSHPNRGLVPAKILAPIEAK
jgi:DNA-binding transcriptional LysR family regulator